MTRLPHYEFFLRQIFDSIDSEVDYSLEKRKINAQKMIDTYPGTLDAIMVRINVLGIMQAEGKLSEIKDEIDNIALTGDNYVDYAILDIKYSLYYGFNDPSISLSKSEEYRAQALEKFTLIVFQSDLEEIWTNIGELRNKLRRTQDREEILQYLQKLDYYANKYENNGITIALANDIAGYYLQIGMIDKAIELYRLSISKNTTTDYGLMPYTNLAFTYFLSNDLVMANNVLREAEVLYSMVDSTWLKGMYLDTKWRIAEMQHDFPLVEDALHQWIDLTKASGEYYKHFMANYQHFMFHYRQIGHHSVDNAIDKAREIFLRLEEIQINHPEDSIVQNYALHAHALLLKNGIMRQRVQAIDILEKLVLDYPMHVPFKVDLIELYWSDLEYDSAGEVKKSIDNLLEDIKKQPIMDTEHLNYSNYVFKLLLAQYQYFIEGNPNEALQQLYAYKIKAQETGFIHLKTLISIEIEKLEAELSKWQDLDLSVKERVRNSQFQTYINEAKSIMGSEL